MRKIIAAAVSITAIAALAIPALASADVARYQTTNSLSLTTTYNGVNYVHNYTLTTNPCVSDSFTGVSSDSSPVGIDETVSGTLNGSNIDISGAYHDGSEYTWHYSGPLSGGGSGGDSLGLRWSVVFKTDTSSFKNHGDYVSSQGGGADAAHSCIGMPINSK
jgi:hypothetical protein